MAFIKFKSSKFYRGNSNIHKCGISQEYTLDQIREIKRCKEDVLYFAEKYFYIVNIDQGKIKIPLYEYQKKALIHIEDNRFNVFCQSRQSGKSTTLTISILHYILFNKDKRVALLGNKAAQSREILQRIKMAYELLPMWLKHGVSSWNKGSIDIENGCSIIAAATSSSSIRGESIAMLLIDEAAFVENWEDFYTSTYPTIASGKDSRVVLVSTANGMNHFYKIWMDAHREGTDGNEFAPFEVAWNEVPNRDAEWKRTTIANTSEEAFLQEHENVFLGSSNTLVSVSSLRSMAYMEPIYENQGVKIFKRVIAGHTYVAAVDTARGSKNDYSAISIIDVTNYPFEQVATYRNNEISYVVYPDIVYRLCKEYNDAWAIIENNDIGGHVVHELNDTFEYDNIVHDSNVKYDMGVRTTVKTKNTGCSNLKDLVENQKLIIYDFDTIAELSTFEEKGRSFQASKGHHDDMAMTLVMFSWFTTNSMFEDISSMEYKKDIFSKQIEDIYESLMPEPFIVNGLENEEQYISEGGELWDTGASEHDGF